MALESMRDKVIEDDWVSHVPKFNTGKCRAFFKGIALLLAFHHLIVISFLQLNQNVRDYKEIIFVGIQSSNSFLVAAQRF